MRTKLAYMYAYMYTYIMTRDVPYPEYADKYSITIEGEVISKQGGTKISQRKNTHGYMQVNLYANGLRKTAIVHRMVAEAFIPRGTDPTLQVDHIDNDKENNHASNLQWLTPSQNVAKTFKQGREGSRKGKTMGKNMVFYINNDIEQKLREIQKQGGSMGGMVNQVLREHFFGTPIQNTPLPENTEPPKPASRSVGDILADIRKLEGERDEELRFSQDGDYSEGITRSYGERIQDLWNEYHLVKG